MGALIELLKAIFFGIVEGVTEWLPISSTGHLILVHNVLELKVSKEFWKMFEVVIQFGAILAVVLLFWDRLWIFKKEEGERKPVLKTKTVTMWIKIVVACIPAAVVGILFDDIIDKLFYKPLSVAVALIVVGVLFILTEDFFVKKIKPDITSVHQINLKDALIIGVFQLLAAVFPGTSRSGATIVGGLILGLSRKTAAEFTFFMAVPVMFGASLLKGVKYMATGLSFSLWEVAVLILGTFTAFIVSLFVIRFLMNYIKKNDFKVFGWYRIGLGAVIIISRVLF